MEFVNSAKRLAEKRNLNKAKRKSLRIASGIIKFIFLFGFCFVILYPVATMILKTFMVSGLLHFFCNATIPEPARNIQHFPQTALNYLVLVRVLVFCLAGARRRCSSNCAR